MASHRLKRALRAALVATAVAASVTAVGAPATAQPPAGSADALAKYEEVASAAEKANEDLLRAQEDLKAKQGELDKANGDVAQAQQAVDQAKADEDQFRGRVDGLVGASFEGARFNQLSALLVSDSQQDFLNRMSALRILAGDNEEAIDRLSGALAQADDARAKAQDAQRRAQEATDAAAKLAADAELRKNDLDGQIQQLRQAKNNLSSGDRANLGGVKDTGSYLGPPGAANDALQAALSKRGSDYLWGGTGPDRFDCSGLTQWAYRAAGVQLPRVAAAQYGVGKPVSQNELRPGDLVFYDDGSGNPDAIHHVAMYVGEGKMVDAPTEGQLVDVRALRGDGHYIGARRIVG